MNKKERIGIIGGSGLYNLEGIKLKKEIKLSTPFGKPSDKFVIGELEEKEIVFLARHGRHHTINPSEINYRANIWGMKKLNVGWIISVSSCGSLKEEIKPLDFVLPDQFIDRTNQGRKQTFFEKGCVVHISFAHPVCNKLIDLLFESARKLNINVHKGGVYLNMEGPQFSTLAESFLYRQLHLDIIGMTNMTEARLAREAEICYASLVAVTDYDCWKEEIVNVEIVLENLKKNIENAKKILKEVIKLIDEERNCSCKEALKYALVTSPLYIPQKTKERLKIIIGKYLK